MLEMHERLEPAGGREQAAALPEQGREKASELQGMHQGSPSETRSITMGPGWRGPAKRKKRTPVRLKPQQEHKGQEPRKMTC